MAKNETNVNVEADSKDLIRAYEGDILQGLLSAADYRTIDQKKVQIIRDGKLYFEFTIQPLSEEEYERCRKKHTKYVRNKQLGVKMPEDTDRVSYRCALIYQATIPEDREKLWDNKQLWKALSDKGMQVLTGLHVIENVLKSGEKEKVIELIDRISGYEDNLEEVVKN